ncbi:hypothetical protein [Nonomuraea aridisoli]|uniref:Uncharacterized protein n=1 Tax=Nonomuraea aridisoli TaxID=2070368 RepID=A0A2W2DTF8_9ACTN|nr:hypothetical protein [Nonomuraea aridisoli]PZG15216.1 hypothetical protein C1J01_24665 [Nonomuraea aridisoli]
MMRLLAALLLQLYPRPWRRRYGDEVADLIAARPVRARTLFDLAGGAADAWLHRRRIPGATPLRVPPALTLPFAAYTLILLWTPGVSHAPSLRGVSASAAGHGAIAQRLAETATSLFVVAGVLGLLSLAPLVTTALPALRGSGTVTRAAARRVLPAVLVATALVGVFHVVFHQLARSPAGPLGAAMAGGFLVPITLALVLLAPMVAARTPGFAPDVCACGTQLAIAAICTTLGWLAVGVLLALGLAEASQGFLTAVAAGAVISIGMVTLTARSVMRPSGKLADPAFVS